MIILCQSKLQCLHRFVYLKIYNPETETKSQVRGSHLGLSFGVPLYLTFSLMQRLYIYVFSTVLRNKSILIESILIPLFLTGPQPSLL